MNRRSVGRAINFFHFFFTGNANQPPASPLLLPGPGGGPLCLPTYFSRAREPRLLADMLQVIWSLTTRGSHFSAVSVGGGSVTVLL